jgi:hypothetical protein
MRFIFPKPAESWAVVTCWRWGNTSTPQLQNLIGVGSYHERTIAGTIGWRDRNENSRFVRMQPHRDSPPLPARHSGRAFNDERNGMVRDSELAEKAADGGEAPFLSWVVHFVAIFFSHQQETGPPTPAPVTKRCTHPPTNHFERIHGMAQQA